MKRVALVGLPYAGKSTVFEAVTRAHAAGGREANVAVVAVPDPRVDRLAEIEASEKRTYARVELLDTPGFEARALADARESDALAIVLRAYGDDADAAADLSSVRAELAVADLQTMEKAVERARKKARSGETQAKAELEVFERAEEVLSSDRWLSEHGWEPAERRTLSLLTPLTLKPALHVLNAGEDGTDPTAVAPPSFVVLGQLEAEASDLAEEDAVELLASYGVESSATSRFVRTVYELLDLVTFLTTGPTESRAWEVPRGTKAPQAAGTVHSDFERAFIRAETVAYDDLVEAGSWDSAKAAGKMRLEGKDYVVREGDVMIIRHSA